MEQGEVTVQKEENVQKKDKKISNGVWTALIVGISLIICTVVLTGGFLQYKGKSVNGGITATGSASCDFESDLIVWRGSFMAFGESTASAYGTIKKDAESVRKYLLDNGIKEDEIVFSSVNISEHYDPIYDDEGNYVSDEVVGYDLYQDVCITSNDVDKVEQISRDITSLIESGIEFTSGYPEYYYTKLDELKLELIQNATENARTRVELIAAGTGCSLGQLSDANLGVFQITATNSSSEDYSYGGTFNTSSRNKTASITVNLNYKTK